MALLCLVTVVGCQSENDTKSNNNTSSKLDFSNVKIGDYIKFGKYEQDNNTSNGKEDIEWLVLDLADNRILVISKYVLDEQPYHTSENEYVDWETCSIRAWLNNEFYNSAFSDKEKAQIPEMTIHSDTNPKYDHYYFYDPSYITNDKVFFLSKTEVEKYFPQKNTRGCHATETLIANGAAINERNEGKIATWSLRTIGQAPNEQTCVDSWGDFWLSGVVNSICYVRPALWIDISNK